MTLARLLSRGVGSWLHFEQASNRSGLFGEKYLALPIGQILSGNLGERVDAEFRHPVLAPLMKGRGRRPEVDFVIFDEKPRISVAVESKWVGSTKPTVQSILWDLVRLELIAHQEKAECFFVLAGKKSRLDELFKTKVFAAEQNWHPHPLIEYTHNGMHNVNLLPVAKHRNDMLQAMFKDYQDFPFPHHIVARRSTPYPDPCSAKLPQVYVWKISASVKRQTFRPSSIDVYRVT
jgi:hypothetical protein